MVAAFWMAVGLVMLTVGAEVLVRGAARLARLARLSSLVIGLTVVAYGTSAPELAVSIKAAMSGQADVAVGNVVGSNTFNVLFILGLSAIIAPLIVSRQLVRLDVPVMIGVSLLAWLLASNGVVGRVEGALLMAGAIAYTVFLVWQGRRQTAETAAAADAAAQNADDEAHVPFEGGGKISIWRSLALIAVGLTLLIFGGRWLVSGAVDLARHWGVSELMIGLTIISAGTSLPEVATSVMASIRGERDIAVGNVVGSNIFNILAVLGTTAVMAGGVPVAPAAINFDIPVAVAIAVVCLPIFFTGGRISRWEGAVLLAYYGAYIMFLAMQDARHASLPTLSATLAWFALPATALGIGLSLYYAMRTPGAKA